MLPARMTFLPILQRELRVRARNPANYWGRLTVAAIGMLVCTPPLLWSGPFMAPASIGRSSFNGLVGAAFVLCCAACLLTADTVSSERREGTLGLLLLTRVRLLDVLLGKFASNGMACLGGLVAFVPVLALPLLTGGVTGGEAMRKALVLLDLLFLAMSVGLWASACGTERFRTARLAVVVLAALVLGPALFGWLLPDSHASLVSPIGTLSEAADIAYKAAAGPYWLSLGIVHLVGWAFLCSAALLMRSGTRQFTGSWDQGARGVSQPDSKPLPAWRPTHAATDISNGTASQSKCRYCGRLNEVQAVFCHESGTVLHPIEVTERGHFDLSSAQTPLHWLLRRQRGLQPMLWLAAVLGSFHAATFAMVPRFVGGGFVMLFFGVSAFGLAISAITGSILAWVASRFFVQARRTGELELLLTTPLGARQIVSAQWDTLKRLILGPVVLMLIPGLLQGALFMLSFRYRQSELWEFYYTTSTLLRAVNIILNVNALCWLALWFGSRTVGQARAILWSVLLANSVPYLLSFAWSILYQPLLTSMGFTSYSRSSSSWIVGYLLPQIVTVAFYLWTIRIARLRLLHELAGAEPFGMRELLSSLLPQIAAATRRARHWPGV